MGLFWSSKKYSSTQKSMGTDELQKIIRTKLIPFAHISDQDKNIVEKTLIATKGSDGALSLQQIHEALKHLRQEHYLTEHDEKDIMNLFKNYFENKIS